MEISGQARRVASDSRSARTFVNLLDLAQPERRHDRSAIGSQFHQADGGEFLQGFADGGAADVKQVRQILFAQTIARFPRAAKNTQEHSPDEIRLEDGLARGPGFAEGGGSGG